MIEKAKACEKSEKKRRVVCVEECAAAQGERSGPPAGAWRPECATEAAGTAAYTIAP